MDDLNYGLLGKILSGEAKEEEKAQFHEWLNQSQENQEVYELYCDFYSNSVIAEEFQTKSRSRHVYMAHKPKRTAWLYWAAAASIILIMGIVFILLAPGNQAGSQLQASSIISKSNPYGQKSRISLPDGSIVWLNAHSSIEYPENFDDSIRTIRISGEAYFEVSSDASRPFIVDAGKLRTTVLGTSFNISNYNEDQILSVALATGKIKVEREGYSEILQPGSQVSFNKINNSFAKHDIDIEKIAPWKNGILVFEQEDFQSVARRLERWYDVQITVTGQPSPEWRFTGYFDNENLKNVLEVLSFGKKLNYEIKGKNVELIRQ